MESLKYTSEATWEGWTGPMDAVEWTGGRGQLHYVRRAETIMLCGCVHRVHT